MLEVYSNTFGSEKEGELHVNLILTFNAEIQFRCFAEVNEQKREYLNKVSFIPFFFISDIYMRHH